MGAASALCAAFVPAYARIFLRSTRRDAEVRQCAQCLFLDHDLCRTRARTAVLLLVAQFERRVELVADRGFAGRVSPAEWDAVVDATTERLAQGECAAALLAGLDRLETLLRDRGYVGRHGADELPNEPLEAA
jgi:putative membrane protein